MATRQRDKMSRPSWSVPKGCLRVGACNAAIVSLISGSNGATRGPSSAMATSSHEQAEGEQAVTGFSDSTCRMWPSAVLPGSL